MTDDAQPIYERGDVVYGDDLFKGDEAARPWVIVSNHEGRPFHGEQYIALTLTTKSWMDGLVEIPDESWVRGGTPDESRIVPGASSHSTGWTSTGGKAGSVMTSSTGLSPHSSTNSSSTSCVFDRLPHAFECLFPFLG